MPTRTNEDCSDRVILRISLNEGLAHSCFSTRTWMRDDLPPTIAVRPLKQHQELPPLLCWLLLGIQRKWESKQILRNRFGYRRKDRIPIDHAKDLWKRNDYSTRTRDTSTETLTSIKRKTKFSLRIFHGVSATRSITTCQPIGLLPDPHHHSSSNARDDWRKCKGMTYAI